MESLRLVLGGIVGGAQEGNKVMQDLLYFAVKTPFQIQGLGDATKQLIASKVATEDLIPTMTLLGDIASISGGDVMGLSRIYTKIQAMPKLQMRAIHQLGARGIPMAASIAELLSSAGQGPVSIGQVTEAIAEGKISSKLALHVLEQMNKVGGVAHRAMIIQSGTVPGLWSNIADEMNMTWSIIGDIVEEFIGVKSWLNSIIIFLGAIRDTLTSMARNHPFITGSILTLITFFSILGPILAFFGGFIVHLVIMAAAMAALNYYTGGLIGSLSIFKAVMGAVKFVLSATALAILKWIAVAFAVVAVIGLIWYNWDSIVQYLKESTFRIIMWFLRIKEVASNMWGGVTNFFGSILAEMQGQVGVIIDVNDPNNYVERVSTESYGPYNFKTGFALAGQR